MYLDRHSIALLLAYSAAEDHDELELRRWLSVLVDRATVQGREQFAAAVANTNYPVSAITPVAQAPGDVQLAIDRAPPALLLMLHEDVHPDNTDPRNLVPEELVEAVKGALTQWDTGWLERAATETGWTEPQVTQEPDPPLGPEPEPEDTKPKPLPPSEPEETPEPEPVPPPADAPTQTDEPTPQQTFSVDRRIVYGGAVVGALALGYLAWKKLQT